MEELQEKNEYEDTLVDKWEPILKDISNKFIKKTTAMLLENQAKQVTKERRELREDTVTGTGTGNLGTFQKFAFPLVRRVYPQLVANYICGMQPMSGPVSQIFYIGHSRQWGTVADQTVYSKFNLTYRNYETSGIFGAANFDLDQAAAIPASALLGTASGSPSTTIGGQIAAWPVSTTIWGFDVSTGESMAGTGIPEIAFHIEQQPIAARTRKMRALWTIEASQDLRAYHDMDLEKELTDLLSKELSLEIDREIVEDIRMIAYDVSTANNTTFGGFNRGMLDQANSNNFGADGTGFTPAQYLYNFANAAVNGGTDSTNPVGQRSNVFLVDLTSSALPFAPQHAGHVYSNLLAAVNFAAQDIYKSTWRGPATWLLTSPLIGAMLESAAKLEGGLAREDGPSNMGANSIEYKGKFAGRYNLFIDPLFPEDEIMMGYKGDNPMDAGYVHAPYIPLQLIPTVVNPEDFQPRKGILTRYGKAAISPEARFYRIVRIIGPGANYLITPFEQNAAFQNAGWGNMGVQLPSPLNQFIN